MLAVVNRELVAAGSPPLRVKVVSEPYEGQLVSQEWEIHISADQFSGGNLTAAKFARLCEVFAHEGRHAVQFWRMARIDPARSYDLDPIVKLAAADANSGGRPAEQRDPGSLKYKETQDMIENVYGANADKRNEILSDMRTGLEDMNVMRKELKDADDKALPLNHPDRVLAQQTYEAARRLHDDAQQEYLAFAEEIDARQVGESTAATVRKRLGHRRALENAQVAERDAYAAYQSAMATLAAGGFKYRHRLERRQQQVKDALEAWKTALEKMQRQETNLANLAKPKPKTTAPAGTPKP